MFETFMSTSYDMVMRPDESWVIRAGEKSLYSGTMREVVTFMVQRLGFDIDEIEVAIEEVGKHLKNGHDGAHFGMHKRFIFTQQYNQQEKGIA